MLKIEESSYLEEERERERHTYKEKGREKY